MSLYDDASLIVTPNGVKAGKLYAIKPTSGAGDLTVVRATTARRVNSAGLIEGVAANVPRLDYSNGSCPSILVEPQRTNLCIYSTDLSNSTWGKDFLSGSLSVSTNSGVSPDGNNNATRLQMSFTSGGYSSVLQVIDLPPMTTYTYSVYMKSLSGTPTICFFNDGVSGNKLITLSNQWERYTFTITSSGSQAYPRFLLADGLTSNSADFLMYGAQLEAGSYATSYIPTVASSVTRNADVISKTGLTGSSVITETFDNNTTNIITNPTTYTMSQGRIKQVIRI